MTGGGTEPRHRHDSMFLSGTAMQIYPEHINEYSMQSQAVSLKKKGGLENAQQTHPYYPLPLVAVRRDRAPLADRQRHRTTMLN